MGFQIFRDLSFPQSKDTSWCPSDPPSTPSKKKKVPVDILQLQLLNRFLTKASIFFRVPFKNQGLIIAPILEISRTKNPIRRFSPILTVIFHRLQIGTPGFLQCTGEDAPFKVKQVPFLVPHGFLFQKTKPSCFQNSFRSV